MCHCEKAHRVTADWVSPCCCAGLQWWMLLQALLFASYAWAVEARRLALAVAFMARFETIVTFPSVIRAPQGGWRRTAVKLAAGHKAWCHADP